jgi:hypothetical protein
MDWHALRIPFNVADVDFRPGATTKDKTKAIGLAYVDKRIYEDRLDDLIGPGNWSVEYRQLGDKGIICRLIIDNVVREDVGEFATDDVASFPTAVAQAFKRACSSFGLGRYLYSLPQVWAEYDADRRRFTDNGMGQLRASLNGNHKQSDKPAQAKTAAVTPKPRPATEISADRLIQRIETLLLQAVDVGAEVELPNDWQRLNVTELTSLGTRLATALKE